MSTPTDREPFDPRAYIPNPTIIERTGRGERHYDVWSRLLEDRIVYLGTPINDTVANLLIGQLLVLEKTDRNRDVHLYINSPGGSISAGLAVYDTLQYIACPVETVCIGSAASMAAILLAAGSPGKRYALPHARVMIHQPWGGVHGTAADIEIQAEEILYARSLLNQILSKHTPGVTSSRSAAIQIETTTCPPPRPSSTGSSTRSSSPKRARARTGRSSRSSPSSPRRRRDVSTRQSARVAIPRRA